MELSGEENQFPNGIVPNLDASPPVNSKDCSNSPHSPSINILKNSMEIEENTKHTSFNTPISSKTPVLFSFAEIEGKYKILEKVGEGTFCCVFKAIPIQKNYPYETVALKRIYPTCSPSRILNELDHLRTLGGRKFVPKLLGVLRLKDQVTIVLPYFEHHKFKEYLPLMNLNQIRLYMKSLFEALHHLHMHKIIHRDIKPGNFLYNAKTQQFMLVDFGLAQKQIFQNEFHSHQSNNGSLPLKRKRDDFASKTVFRNVMIPRENTSTPQQAVLSTPSAQDKAVNQSKRPPHAARAGTRGFRAPEVLLKYPYQTVAIDIWSAGIIFLCILSTRYPFFHSPDDLTSLAEIGALCGTSEIENLAKKLDRRVTFPKAFPKENFKILCESLSVKRNYKIPESAYDLLERCLDIDPCTRISADEALNHPFIYIE